MKKLAQSSNPFILLLIPVLFALIMGISYQFQQKREAVDDTTSLHAATSLFYKGTILIKTVCTLARERVW